MNSLPRPGLFLPTLAVLTMSALSLSACASSTDPAAGGAGPMTVLASFYPIQFLTEQVGGGHVEVRSITPPGAEPHNLEISPAKVAELEAASAVVYASGFQAAVDEAVEQTSLSTAIDVAGAAQLSSADGGRDQGGVDPHFWLDPDRLVDVTNLVAERFSEVDPENEDSYRANADALIRELSALDNEFRTGLATCERRTIVVAHEAYGYLADRYGLKQEGVSGIDPESEPAPARIAKIRRVIEGEDVTTIFTESLVNPKVAETLASDLGVETALLDPLESHTASNAGYLDIMRGNLASLRKALNCE